MPTYEYHCDACEHGFDEFQSMSDAPLKKCPKCGKRKLRRVFGAGAAVIFKGSGFYQTDYRSDAYKAAAKAESDSSKPAADKTESDASKPAADKTDTGGKAGNGATDKKGKSEKKTTKSSS
jgi:putative FmdB family regulatory protein